MKIKIKYHSAEVRANAPIVRITKGEWLDLATAEKVQIKGPTKNPKTNDVDISNKMINLGISIQLPKDFEAVVLSRSSTYKSWGIIAANAQGVIDSTYCGDNDIWKYNAIALRDTEIPLGTRIAQFRIQPSQFAPFWVKLKWLLTSKIEFIEVDSLGNEDRGGWGSTGK